MVIYSAFDVYPSYKGCATHIMHMSEALFQKFKKGKLIVLGNEKLPTYQEEGDIEIYRIRISEENFLKRTEIFTLELSNIINKTKGIQLCHFRDIWSGKAIVSENRKYKTVFEVNSLPSIELPFKYGALNKSTLDKIISIENYCLEYSDKIITPSEITKKYLIGERKIPSHKIQVISNGAEKIGNFPKPVDAPEKYIIYFGALQKWQGVEILLQAFSELSDIENLKLIICSSQRENSIKYYHKLSDKLKIDHKIIWKYMLSKNELNAYLQHAMASIVPLREDERNIIQGANPIKIIESMAASAPLIVSDLPICKEILTDGIHAKFVRPDRPLFLSRAIRFFYENPEFRFQLQKEALTRFLEEFTWEKKKKELKLLYQELISIE